MNTRYLKYITIIWVTILTVSCEDMLDEVNPNQSSSSTFWKNLTHTDGSLISTYGVLQSHFVLNIREEAWRSDMAIPGFGRPSYAGEGVPWYNQLYSNTNPQIMKKWETLYLGNYRANQTIEGLNRLKGTVNEEQWTTQMAQARFLRGLFHFYLYTSFNKGEVIIRDHVPVGNKDHNLSVSSAEEVLAFVRKDLRYAYQNLPAQWGKNSEDMGRATKGAAATTLGNSFLFENEYDSAMVYFEDIVLNKTDFYGYELEKDSLLQLTNAGEFNKESIFEIPYDNTAKPEYGSFDEDRMTNRLADYTSTNKNTAFHPCLWITWEYLTDVMDSKDLDNYLADGTTMRNVSRRASAMLAVMQDEQRPYYNDQVFKKTSFTRKNGYARYRKYSNWDILNDEKDNSGGRLRSSKNVTINRLAEVYLNLAECYIQKGKLNEAIDLINQNRSRWGLRFIGLSNGDTEHDYDEVSYTADDLMKFLMYKEKPMELSVEGHTIRWVDMRRWGILQQNLQQRAQEVYWTQHYIPIGSKNKTYTHSTITKIDPKDDDFLIYKDYEQAAANFNYDLHAWLPIPSTEEVSNPNLYNK